jgi:formylglycine-generating enzyme required for sulfatase activity
MKKIILISTFVLLAIHVFAAAPVVSNVVATPSSGIVTISYDLAADGPCKITVLVSADGGTSYNIYPSALSGAVGDQVTPGTGKQIIWNPAGDGMQVGANYKVKVIARDNPTQNQDQFTSFIKVEGGTFYNGTSNVTLSTFYIDKYEITQNDYHAVMGVNPSYFAGNPNRPVEWVSWYNAIEYCNRRSMQEGYMPCYSYSTYGTDPSNWPSGWNTIAANHTNVSCNWTANGYRLPTEMEWVFAAKGGNQSQGYTYSGSNTIDNVAWYSSNSGSRTWDVGSLASNELGIYDMSGNIWEWCWDIYGNYPSGAQTDPHGATSGSDRVRRGGSWYGGAYNCTDSWRSNLNATYIQYNIGFRCVRVSP